MKYKINTVLHTKDGRRTGNAIIIGREGKFNLIKTDYGNNSKLTDEEIEEEYYIAFADYSNEEMKHMRATLGEHKHARIYTEANMDAAYDQGMNDKARKMEENLPDFLYKSKVSGNILIGFHGDSECTEEFYKWLNL